MPEGSLSLSLLLVHMCVCVSIPVKRKKKSFRVSSWRLKNSFLFFIREDRWIKKEKGKFVGGVVVEPWGEPDEGMQLWGRSSFRPAREGLRPALCPQRQRRRTSRIQTP